MSENKDNKQDNNIAGGAPETGTPEEGAALEGAALTNDATPATDATRSDTEVPAADAKVGGEVPAADALSTNAAVPVSAAPSVAAKAAAELSPAASNAAAPAADSTSETPKAAPVEKTSARSQKRSRREKGNRRAVRRRWPAIVAGVATAALAVAAVGGASLYPGMDATAVTEPVPHVLPVGVSMANCQGPTQLLAGSAAGADPEFSANSSSTKTLLNAIVLSGATGEVPGASVQSLDGKFSPLFTVAKPLATPSGAPTASPSALTGEPKAKAQVVTGKAVDAASVLQLDPLAGESSQGAGSVVVDATDGDLAGLAGATCQAPANELWLAGASTTVGRTAILSLSNSSETPANVSLELFGSNGPVQAAGSKGLVVAPGSVRSVVLSGLAPDEEMLTVHVKSVGGPVSGTIQQSILRGLTPGGIDYLAPVQAPAQSLTIPGVQVRAASDSAKITAQKGYEDATTVLAVTVPGISDAVLEVKAFGADGQVPLPDGGVFTATAGKVSTLSLAGLPAGNYSLAVSSDAPVAAAARLVNFTKAGDAVDLSFATSTARLGDTHVLTLPAGVESRLAFAAIEGSATINLVPVSASGVLGEGKDVELRAGSSVTVDPAKLLGSGAVAVVVSASGAPAFGSQLLLKDGSAGMAVLPITPSVAGNSAINIITRY